MCVHCLCVCVCVCLCRGQFYVDAQCTNLKLPIGILIGTVPLSEAFFDVQSAPGMQPSIITTQPLEAPPLEPPDHFNLRTYTSAVFCYLFSAFYDLFLS